MKRFSCDVVTGEYEAYFKTILKRYKIYDPYTYSYIHLFSESNVDEIRRLYDGCPRSDGSIGNNGEVNNSRRTKVHWIPPTDELNSILMNAITEENELRYGFELSGTSEKVQYTVYTSEEQGHYDWHIDAMKPLKRKLSAVVQLSDPSEYEGGELQIQNGGIHIVEKKKGTCVVFPSWMSHRVTPVTKGVRRSLVVWVEGPPFI
jgi:PKHD-type hydroxylase